MITNNLSTFTGGNCGEKLPVYKYLVCLHGFTLSEGSDNGKSKMCRNRTIFVTKRSRKFPGIF
jgi:hypothetical protein